MPDLDSAPLTLDALTELLRAEEPVRLAAADAPAPARAPSPPAGWPYLLQAEQLAENPTQLEADLLLAHAAGTGPELPSGLVRRMLLLKAYRLSQQHASSLQPAARQLLDFFNRDVWPVVYEQGALGTADNQIPLAHLSLPLLGLGEVNYQGYRLAAADVLGLFGWEPLRLQAQQGHALLHGGEFTLAYATEALVRATHLLGAAAAIGTLATALHKANWRVEPLPDAAQETGRPQLLAADAPAFQSFALVHEAAAASIATARTSVEEAIRAPAELTLLFSAPDLLLSRRLAGQLPALLLREVAWPVARVGELSARRLTQLVAGGPQLPPYPRAGLGGQFGLLVLPQLAGSLVIQNQQLARVAAFAEHPELAPDLPDLNAAGAANVLRVVEATEQLLGLELLAVAQAQALLGSAGASPVLAAAVEALRERVTFVAHHRVLTPDLHRAAEFVRQYAWPATAR